MNSPLISVVIPTYNYGAYVTEAVDSVLAQTHSPVEVIVVDDGSTDDTRARLQRYGDRIRYLYQHNQHLSAARNTGIRAARGEWIAFLDSDDRWHPQKLERQWLVLTHVPHLRAIGTNSVNLAQLQANARLEFAGKPPLRHVSLRDLVYGVHFSGGSAAMVHRNCFTDGTLFDESLRSVEDLDMWFRLASRYNLARVLEPLTWVRVHPTSMSAQALSMESNHRRALHKAFTEIPDLRGKCLWRRVATARMHRGVAWMHHEAGNRNQAIFSLLRSFLACPVTSGTGSPLLRCRMLARLLLS